jgi:hypothetical protein
MKMMIIKQQLKKCTGRLDKLLKKGRQVEALGGVGDATRVEF